MRDNAFGVPSTSGRATQIYVNVLPVFSPGFSGIGSTAAAVGDEVVRFF